MRIKADGQFFDLINSKIIAVQLTAAERIQISQMPHDNTVYSMRVDEEEGGLTTEQAAEWCREFSAQANSAGLASSEHAGDC